MTIFGATGQTGRLLVQQALEGGHTVTAVVRDASRFELSDGRLTVAEVPEITDASALVPALVGTDAALSAIGPRGRRDGPVATGATRSIIAATKTAGVDRIIVISAAPVGSPPPGDSILNRYFLMPLIGTLLRPVYDDLRDMEAELAASATDWTAFRPPRLTTGALTGRARTTIGTGVPRGYAVSRADLAHAMLDSIGRPETFRTAVGIAR
jgi:putative NADH-flavin reductase